MSIQKLTESIFRCVQDPSHWETTLNEYTDHFGLLSACIFTVHDFERERSGLYFSDYLRSNLAEDLRKKIESGSDVEDHEAYAQIMRLEPLVPHDELKIMNVDTIDELPASDIRAGGEAIGVKMRIPTVLNTQGPWLEGLFAHTKRSDDHIAYQKDPEVRILMPVLSGVVALNKVFEGLKARYNAALTALDQLGLGVFVLNDQDQVVLRNKAAGNMLDQSDGITVDRDGKLRFKHTESGLEFRKILNIHKVGLHADLIKKNNMLAVPRPSGLYDFLFTVRPLSDSTGELEKGFKGAFVIAIDPERRGVLSAAGISALGSLTKTEQEIAEALVQGFKVAEISERRDVQENTVRMQIKALLQKLRCKSQSDVIRVAAATRLPFVD